MATDPYLSFRFQVEFMGVIRAGFSEVSGLDVEIEIEEYWEGGINQYMHKLPKGVKHSNLVLKKGLAESSLLWEWHYAAQLGVMTPTPGRIIMYDSQGNENIYWAFFDAYPVKWSGPQLKGDDNSVAIESLELAHSGLLKLSSLVALGSSVASMI